MAVSRWCRSASVLGALFVARPALGGPEGELAIMLQSDDLLTGAAPARNVPWRSLASREAEPESRARISLQLQDPGFWASVSTTALLRVEAPLSVFTAGDPLSLRDASSSIAIAKTWALPARLELRAFPFDTDYWRVGYLHALDFGGTNVAARESFFLSQEGGVPGALAALRLARVRIEAGSKWTQPSGIGGDRLWGFLGAAQVEPSRAWRFDLGLAHFERPKLAPGLGSGAAVQGGSLRVVLRRGVGEPRLAVEPFRRASFAEEAFQLRPAASRGEALALEVTTLVGRQPLLQAAPAVRWVPAPAAAVYGSLQRGAFRGHFVALWRSLRFVLRNERSVLALPSPQGLEHSELAGWVGGSVTPGAPPLSPGCELGVVMPAVLETAGAWHGYNQSFVAGPAGLAPLPVGARVLPLLAARLSLRFEPSNSVVLGALVDYVRDPNATRLLSSGQRAAATADRLSLQVGALARF